MANPIWFIEQDYLASKLKQLQDTGNTQYTSIVQVRAAIEGAGMTLIDHFNQYGALEQTSPNANFNAKEYLAAKAKALGGSWTAEKVADAFFQANLSPWQHYHQHGDAEGLNPSNAFDTNAYYAAKVAALNSDGPTIPWTVESLKEYFQANGLDAISHYNAYGAAEGLVVTPVPPADRVDADTGKTFTLTTAPDNIVGTSGNDVVNGYLNTTVATAGTSTLTAADVIDGGAGVDSLKLTVEGAVAGVMPNAAISNVENFFIRDVATAASSYDFSTINGEQQVWADTATNAAGVTFANLGTGATVGIKGNNVMTNLSNVSFSMATATDAVSIAIDGGVKNAVAPTITNTTAGAATAATISSTGAANTVGAITLAAAATNTVKTLTVNAATNLTAVLTTNDFAADAVLTVTGAGKADLGANFVGNTIDASANTGGLSISTTAGVTKAVTGSSASDTVTLVGALTATGSINLGAGDDKLLVGAGAAIGANNVIDGGDGIDSISASLINAANAGVIKNFEILDMSATTIAGGLDVELVTSSTITGLALSGGAGGAILTNVAAGVGLSVSGTNAGLTTVGVKDAATGTADSFATTFAGTAGAAATAVAPTTIAAGTVVTNGIESLSIVSSGTGFVTNTLAVTDSALKTLTITGDKDLGLTFVGTNGTNGGTGGAVSLIDGSTATGKLSINTTNVTADSAATGLTVKGGSAADIITLSQKATVDAGAGNDIIKVSIDGGTLTGGAGDDLFNVEAAIAETGKLTESTGVFKTVITDFIAGDSIKLEAAGTGFVTTKVALDATVTNLDLALAAASNNAVTGQINWFQYGTNTYIVENVDGVVGIQAGDLVIKLAGTIDLSNATYNATTDILTMA